MGIKYKIRYGNRLAKALGIFGYELGIISHRSRQIMLFGHGYNNLHFTSLRQTTKLKCTTMTRMTDLWAECPQSPCPDCCQRSTCTHRSCPPRPSWWSESGDFHDFQSGNCCHSPAAVSDGTIWNFNSEINSRSHCHWYNNVFKIHLILKAI